MSLAKQGQVFDRVEDVPVLDVEVILEDAQAHNAPGESSLLQQDLVHHRNGQIGLVVALRSRQDVLFADQFAAHVVVGLPRYEDDDALEAVALEHAHLVELVVRLSA